MTELTLRGVPQVAKRSIRIRSEFLIAVVVFAAFSLLVPRFFSVDNFINISKVASIIFIASCGQAIVLLLAGIEFSFGASVALASVMTVAAAGAWGMIAGFAVGAASCIALAALNGFFVAYVRVPSFMVTLGSLLMAQGLASTIAGGLPMDAPPGDDFFFLSHGAVLGIPLPVILAAAGALVLAILLNVLTIGRSWALIGMNATAAEAAGLPVRSAVFLGFLAAGVFCALAGLILTSRVGSGQPMLAPDLAFQAIAACAIGGIPLTGGHARVTQVIAGALVIAAIHNAVILLNFPIAYQQIVTAICILAVVLLHGASRVSLLMNRIKLGRRSQ
jgi:ribose/xylose/arabinose/galactoside ABC-type transport system permease subunit